jgi:hypothetical protein
MIVHKIPHNAHYLPTRNQFSAAFTGVYDFGVVAGNQNQVVCPLEKDKVYYIDNFAFGGNIAGEDYLSAINTVPLVLLTRVSDHQNIDGYMKKIPLALFSPGIPATAFVRSNRVDDALLVSISGILNQTANLVGVTPVILVLSFNIYVSTTQAFVEQFDGRVRPNLDR